MNRKPMRATDAVLEKIKFPCIAQPKIDGVRSVCMNGELTGRSLKTHKNRYVTDFFSNMALDGLDGEMAAESETHPDLCRLTTSALNTIEGQPWLLWHLFDYITEETVKLRYADRLVALNEIVRKLKKDLQIHAPHLQVIPSVKCDDLPSLLCLDDMWLDQGYEGTIVRDPNGIHKEGYSTVREGGLLRIKRFIEAEAVVISITEGERNLNEATTNRLGLTERSSHQENMLPNEMVGSMECKVLKDVVHDGKLFFKEGQIITVGAGRMPHIDRLKYFAEQHLLLNQTIKFKTFPKGVKDKPRFPTFQTIRAASDL